MPPQQTERQKRRAQLRAAGASEEATEQAVSQIPEQEEQTTGTVPPPGETDSGVETNERDVETDAGTVTSDDLTDTGDVTTQEPTTETVPSIESIISNVTDTTTPTQERRDEITSEISEETDKLAGQREFRTEQQEELGISKKERTVQDLTNRLNQIKAQEQQIPLQVQQEFEGRGATASGVEPIEASRLRKNAIRALGVSAGLEAAQGNLATAQEQVDRAVEQEFGPIKDKIETLRSNLELIRPQLDREQKRRATLLDQKLAERERNIEEQQTERKNIYDVMTTAAENGADASTLNQIQNASSRGEALRLAQDAGVFTQEADVSGFVRAIERGEMDLENVPADFRQQVAAQVNFGETNGDTEQEAPDIPESFEQFLEDSGINRQDLSEGQLENLRQSYNEEIASSPENLAQFHKMKGFSKEQARSVVEGNFPNQDVNSVIDRIYGDGGAEENVNDVADRLGVTTRDINKALGNSSRTLEDFLQMSDSEKRTFLFGDEEDTSEDNTGDEDGFSLDDV